MIALFLCSPGFQSVWLQYSAKDGCWHRPTGGFGIGQMTNFPLTTWLLLARVPPHRQRPDGRLA